MEKSYKVDLPNSFEEIKEIMDKFPLTLVPDPYPEPTSVKGWICPRCGRSNAPWVAQCICNVGPMVPMACRGCSNHPSNGGSGNCNCTLGSPVIYY